eukprot:TRINITY_DN6174_c0_g1_i1.p1 TRINITY_DN6174_c0_g1~~TRINITY_DN6174_c0_g1_i1.p1  ORF type:complete len:214 (-),score=59.31 TRINITY_DN6174_c0_g1_i1:416-1057(-)
MNTLKKPVILVTGASGFVGKAVVNELLLRNKSVAVITRKIQAFPRANNTHDEVMTLQADLMVVSPSELRSYMKNNNVTTVVHLAGDMNFYPSGRRGESNMFKMNVEVTKKIAMACVEAGTVEKFIYVSSTEAMGGFVGLSSPLSEDSECRPNFAYGESKLKAEQEISDCLKGKLPYVILRPSGIFGPGDNFAIYELMKAIEWGLFFFCSSTKR